MRRPSTSDSPTPQRSASAVSGTTFSGDGTVVKRSAQSLDYPVQLMLDVFEFGAEPGGRYPEEFVGERVRDCAPVSSR